MNKRNMLIAGTVVIILVILGLIIMHGHSNKKPSTTMPPAPASTQASAIIEITPGGFVPSTLSVKPNTNITWVNEDVMPHLPAADPYPSHTSLPSLVAPMALGKKETYTFLVTKTETIKYHDDLHPTLTGTLEVQN